MLFAPLSHSCVVVLASATKELKVFICALLKELITVETLAATELVVNSSMLVHSLAYPDLSDTSRELIVEIFLILVKYLLNSSGSDCANEAMSSLEETIY